MPGRAGSDPEGLVAVRGRLFFSAETPGKGRELWRATPPARAITSSLQANDGSADLTATAFRTSGAPIGLEGDDANADDDDDEQDNHLSGLIS